MILLENDGWKIHFLFNMVHFLKGTFVYFPGCSHLKAGSVGWWWIWWFTREMNPRIEVRSRELLHCPNAMVKKTPRAMKKNTLVV